MLSMEKAGKTLEQVYESRIRTLSVLTGKSKADLEKEIEEQVKPSYPNSPPSVLVAILGAQKYNIARERIDSLTDKVLVLRKIARVSRNNQPFTAYDAIDFNGKLVRILDFDSRTEFKVGYFYILEDFRYFKGDSSTYQISPKTRVKEAGRGNAKSIFVTQPLSAVNSIGFCKLIVLGVKEGVYSACPVCGRRVEKFCQSCREKAVEKRWVRLDVGDGVSEAQAFLKVDESLYDIVFGVGDWIYALVEKQQTENSKDTFNIIYFETEKSGVEEHMQPTRVPGSDVDSRVLADTIIQHLKQPTSRRELYNRLKEVAGEKQVDAAIEFLLKSGYVVEKEGGLLCLRS